MPRIQITEPAKADIEQAFSWWSENHSRDQGVEWYERIFDAIATLARMPERCPLVPEQALSVAGIRQLLFGVGKHPTHRLSGLILESVADRWFWVGIPL